MRPRDFALSCIGVTAIYIATSLFPAPDVRIFLLPWLRHIESAGPVSTFAHPFSNYSPPYLYLLSFGSVLPISGFATIKLIAIAGVCWLAWCMSQLAKVLGRGPFGMAELTVLLPSVILNGPLLGQCDTIWAGCCILAVTNALRNRPSRMAIWAGVAFAFKAQAAFLAPFFIGQVIRHRAWLTTAVPPLVYMLAIVPAALVGWPFADLLTIYLRQPNFTFIGDAPNIWAFPAALHVEDTSIFVIGYLLAIFGAAGVASIRRRDLLLTALLSAMVVPFFLPKMLERFFFAADLLSLANAYARRDRTSIVLVVLVQAGSFLSVTAYLAEWPWLNAGASLLMASALGLTCVALLREQPNGFHDLGEVNSSPSKTLVVTNAVSS